MYGDQGTRRLLAQVPLTVSPFISLPTAVTLPYTYKSVPTSLPPSAAVDTSGSGKARYVVASSGHAAHPDEITASCKALQAHIQQAQIDAERTLSKWEDGVKERELAEKRRVAPGWLDRDEKILQPTKSGTPQNQLNLLDYQSAKDDSSGMHPALNPGREAEELDRVFGGLEVKSRSTNI